MGANAAVKAYEVVENVEQILAIELFNAAQALEFRRPMKSASYIEDLVAQYRQYVKFIENDKVMYGDIKRSLEFIREGEIQIPE
jgi:histidine ammonia-lyase